MRHVRSQLILALVAVVLGFLVVVQLRAQSAGSSLDSKSIQDLTAIIAQLNAGNDQLLNQKTAEEAALSQAQADLQRGVSAAGGAQSDLNQIRGWAGLDAIAGQGVRLTLSGNFPGEVAEDALNELWSAGADGIDVNGIRMVPGIVVSGQSGSLQVGSVAAGHTIVISAIGNRDALAGALQRPGGFLSQFSAGYPEATSTVAPVTNLMLPATNESLIPRDAQPRL
jgi:uncharacterized protein YlxW (UPF0749 family)